MMSLRSVALIAGLLLGAGAAASRAQDPPPNPGTLGVQLKITVNVELTFPWQNQQLANGNAAANFAAQKRNQGFQTKMSGNQVSYRRNPQRRAFTGSKGIAEAQRYADQV